MDLERLGDVVREVVRRVVGSGTHASISADCQKLDLPITQTGSKSQRMVEVVDGIEEDRVPRLASQLLSTFSLSTADRNALEDALWTNAGYPEIPKRTRREIAEALDPDDLYIDARRFDSLLDDLWVLNGDPLESIAVFLGEADRSLRAEIEKHLHRNPGDWSVVEFFDKLGAFDASDHRFALFLEGMASPDIRPNEAEQRRFVDAVTGPLKKQGLELREADIDGGYPRFELVSLGASPRGRPKNLIFASSVKPDLRFRDAIDNDVEIVSDADKVLIYDRPIGRDGLRWSDLQTWWKEERGIDDDGLAKEMLYRRLLASLPESSPPQRALFKGFYKGFSAKVPALPALLPEVWLHWDPKTIRMRGRDALLHSRMDFLLLLPSNVRVVIEVDGQQHYADSQGRADPQRYAQMVAADRDMRLSGYEIYRFGATQLMQEDAAETVHEFFIKLFRLRGIIT